MPRLFLLSESQSLSRLSNGTSAAYLARGRRFAFANAALWVAILTACLLSWAGVFKAGAILAAWIR